MQLKDVEKLTGLSSKAIRLYEEKGLIRVARQDGNAYRVYSTDNIETLRKIKLLRYLDFSVQEIRGLLSLPDEDLRQVLSQKATDLWEAEETLQQKRSILETVRKALAKQEPWVTLAEEVVTIQESETMQNLKQALLPSIWLNLLVTLLYSGPILTLFIDLHEGKLEHSIWLLVVSLLITIHLTLLWRQYIVTWWRHREKITRQNKRTWLVLPLFFLTIALGLGVFVGVDALIQAIFLPEDWLFYESSSLLGKVMIFCPMTLLFLMIEDWQQLWKFKAPKWLYLGLALLSLGGVLVFVDQVTVVTPNKIIDLNVLGAETVYAYDEVEQVKAGFGGRQFTLEESQKKGTFFYQIKLQNRWVTFMAPSVNEEAYADEETYLELEHFDQALMANGVPKQASAAHVEASRLDRQYIDRFLRIIKHQKE